MTRIAHVTSVHPPFDTRIFVKECQSLARAGLDVTLIHLAEESVDKGGVHIIGLGHAPSSRLHRLLFGGWRVFRAVARGRYDCVHIHDPELLPFGMLLRLFGKRVIYDAHEDLPAQLLTKPYLKPMLARIVSRFVDLAERAMASATSGVVAATPRIAKRFQRKTAALVQNYPILQEFQAGKSPSDRNSVAYVGGLSSIRGVVQMVEAIGMVQFPEARLVLIGDFQSQALLDEVQGKRAWSKVEYLGWQDRASVSQQLGQAIAGLALFLPVPHHLESRPNKLFEYMAAGLPVVASNFPAWREVIEKHRCGLLVDPGDPSEIARAIDWLAANPQEAIAMGERGRRAVETSYNWDTEFQELLRMYELILGTTMS